MKCCDSFSGLDAHDQVLKGAPALNSTIIIVSESDLARQLNRSVRPLLFHGVGRSSLATAILESWLLNHLLRETHSFHQLSETKTGAQIIEQDVGLEAR